MISIILVAPQMGENIGATARVMKNFNFSDLRIVEPRDGWPNDKADQMSVGAIDLIKNAKIFSSIEEAISDLDYIYAATAAPRDMNKEYILSKNINKDLVGKQNIGIMFGRENCGLTNDEISFANKILTIDTRKDFSSLNLAHSVAVICYEIFQYNQQNRDDLKLVINNLAKSGEIEFFYKNLFGHLEQKGFFKVPEKKKYMQQKIRNIFSRIDNFSQSELQTMHGIVKILSKK